MYITCSCLGEYVADIFKNIVKWEQSFYLAKGQSDGKAHITPVDTLQRQNRAWMKYTDSSKTSHSERRKSFVITAGDLKIRLSTFSDSAITVREICFVASFLFSR